MGFSNYYKTRKVSALGQMLNTYFAHSIVKEIRGFLKSGDSISEIGPGEGRVAEILKKEFAYSCYEASPSLATHLREMGIDVHEKYAPPMDEKSGSLQAIVATHVLEHMPDYPTAQKLFSEAARTLSNGGIFLVISPDYNDMSKLFYDVDYSHNFVVTANRLSQLATDTGLVMAKKKFLYGALPLFPGLFMNLAMKCVFLPLRFFKENFFFQYKGIFKLEYMFSRAVYMVFTKKSE